MPIRALRSTLPSLMLLIVLVLVWDQGVQLLRVPPYIVPTPGAVWARLARDPLFFGREGLVTLGEALGGLAIGGLLALGAGLLMARWRWIERALLPVAVVAKVTPVVVI